MREEQQVNAFTYNLSNYYYAKGDLIKAKGLLFDVEFTEPAYQPVAKSLLLKIYF